MTRIQLIVAARNRRRAIEIGRDRGLRDIEVQLIDGPESVARIGLQVPIYVDGSWAGHPRSEVVASVVSERLGAAQLWAHWAGRPGS